MKIARKVIAHVAGLKHSNHKLQLALARAQKGPEKKRPSGLEAEKPVESTGVDEAGMEVADQHSSLTHETTDTLDNSGPHANTAEPNSKGTQATDALSDHSEDANETSGSVKIPGAWPHSQAHSSPPPDTYQTPRAPEKPGRVPKVYTYLLGAHDSESACETWELDGQETVLEFLASVRLRHDMKPHRSFRSIEVDIDGNRTKLSFLAPDAAIKWAKLVEAMTHRAEAGVEGAVDILLRAG